MQRYELNDTEKSFFQRAIQLLQKQDALIQGAVALAIEQQGLKASPGHGFNLAPDLSAIIEVPLNGLAHDS